jgi:hypothetical protein
MMKSHIPKLVLGREPVTWGSRQADGARYTVELTPFGVRVRRRGLRLILLQEIRR